jgi:hypothetical protein
MKGAGERCEVLVLEDDLNAVLVTSRLCASCKAKVWTLPGIGQSDFCAACQCSGEVQRRCGKGCLTDR